MLSSFVSSYRPPSLPHSRPHLTISTLQGSEEMLSATQAAAVVVRRHLELVLSVLELLSFNKPLQVYLEMSYDIALHCTALHCTARPCTTLHTTTRCWPI